MQISSQTQLRHCSQGFLKGRQPSLKSDSRSALWIKLNQIKSQQMRPDMDLLRLNSCRVKCPGLRESERHNQEEASHQPSVPGDGSLLWSDLGRCTMINTKCHGVRMPCLPTHIPSASSGHCRSQSWRRDTPQTLWLGPCMCTTPAGEKINHVPTKSTTYTQIIPADNYWPHLLNDFHQVLEHLSPLSNIFVGDHCCCKVSQYMWAHCLDGIQVPEKTEKRSISVSCPHNYLLLNKHVSLRSTLLLMLLHCGNSNTFWSK